jgi:hypothetical protein
MVTLFWNCEGLLLCEYLPSKTRINSDNYEALEKVYEAIKNKRDQDC